MGGGVVGRSAGEDGDVCVSRAFEDAGRGHGALTVPAGHDSAFRDVGGDMSEAAEFDVDRTGNVAGGELRLLPYIEIRTAARPVGSDEGGGRLRVAVGEPGVHACGEAAREALVPDLVCLPDDLAEVLVVAGDEGEGGGVGQEPAEPRGELVAQRDGEGAGDVAGRVVGGGPHVDDVSAVGHQGADLPGGQSGQQRGGRQGRGATPVDLGEPVEIGRVGPQARGEPMNERALVRCGQQRVGLLLAADGGRTFDSRRGGAEGSGTVRGPHGGLVRQRGQPSEGPVLGAGEFRGPFRAEEVGAGGGVHDQRAAGEHAELAGSVQEQEGKVLVGVPGGGKRAQRQPAEIDLVAVTQPPMCEGTASGRGGEHGGAGVVMELDGAGEEVGVQMRVGREGDRETTPFRCPAQGAQVAARVHGQGAAVAQVDEVGTVSQALVDQGYQVVVGEAHHVSFHGNG